MAFLIRTLIILLFILPNSAFPERIKDISSIQGVRNNPLVGYGLVVGLDGTGDKNSPFTQQSFKSMLKQFGINIPAGQSVDLKNVAAVALSAELPPFMKPGQKIDVTASSIGSAKSLRGGTLLMSPLKGADGKVYAIAQGNLIVSGFGAEGKDGSKVSVNMASVGRIPNGATVERTVESPFYLGDRIVYNLYRPDFTTAKRFAQAINHTLGSASARPLDASSVEVHAPKNPSTRVDFVSLLENIQVTPDLHQAKIVVNSRTGTIVIGQYVTVKPAAVTHGNLTVTITENPIISQPNSLSGGETTVVQNSAIKVSEENSRMFLLGGGTSLRSIIRAVNAVGAAPGDLMAILEALKEAGALEGDLVII